MKESFQSSREIEAAKSAAEQQVREELKGKEKHDVLALAARYTHAYGDIVRVRANANRFNDPSYFTNLLRETYPEIPHQKLYALADKLRATVQQELGEPADFPQTELMAASQRRDVSVEEFGRQLTTDEITALEQQAIERIPSEQFPENFDQWKAHWLAEWVASGALDYPHSGVNYRYRPGPRRY